MGGDRACLGSLFPRGRGGGICGGDEISTAHLFPWVCTLPCVVATWIHVARCGGVKCWGLRCGRVTFSWVFVHIMMPSVNSWRLGTLIQALFPQSPWVPLQSGCATSTRRFFSCVLIRPPSLHPVCHHRQHRKEAVYVHCKAGKGRSWVVAACYLIAHEGLSLAETVNALKERRPQVCD